MVSIKVPAKYVDKQFRELGARVTSRQEVAVYYEFPDGRVVAVRRKLDRDAATRLVKDALCRYTAKRRQAVAGESAGRDRPTIDFERLEASPHARERLTLMRQQAPIEWSEILQALQSPDRVLYSEYHDAWTWVGHRIAVCIVVIPSGRAFISTILWADADLWEQYPRPEAG